MIWINLFFKLWCQVKQPLRYVPTNGKSQIIWHWFILRYFFLDWNETFNNYYIWHAVNFVRQVSFRLRIRKYAQRSHSFSVTHTQLSVLCKLFICHKKVTSRLEFSRHAVLSNRIAWFWNCVTAMKHHHRKLTEKLSALIYFNEFIYFAFETDRKSWHFSPRHQHSHRDTTTTTKSVVKWARVFSQVNTRCNFSAANNEQFDSNSFRRKKKNLLKRGDSNRHFNIYNIYTKTHTYKWYIMITATLFIHGSLKS